MRETNEPDILKKAESRSVSADPDIEEPGPDPETVIAQIYAIAEPAWISPSNVASILRHARYRVDRRFLNTNDISRINLKLSKTGVILRHKASYVESASVPKKQVLPLIQSAHEQGHVFLLLDAIEAQAELQKYRRDDREHRTRVYAIVGDTSKLDKAISELRLTRGFWLFLAEPWQDQIYQTLSVDAQINALNECLEYALDYALPVDAMIESLRQSSDQIRQKLTSLASYVRILQGDFDASDRLFEEMPSSLRDNAEVQVDREASRALVSALRGEDDQAQSHIENALTLARGGKKGAMVYPRNRAFTLALVSLVRIDSADSYRLLQRIERAAAKRQNIEWDVRSRFPPELRFVQSARKARTQGYVSDIVVFGEQVGFDLLLSALEHSWLDRLPHAGSRPHKALRAFYLDAKSNGYDWVCAEYEAFRQHVLDRELKGKPVDTLHSRLGTYSLVTLASPLQPWEISFKALEHLAQEVKNQKPRTKKSPTSAKKRRLAWDIREGDLDQPYVSAREQTVQKNGNVSKGRKMSFSRFAKEAANLDFLLPQDRAAASIIAKSNATKYDYVDRIHPEIIHALIGHPYVFNEKGESVDIVDRQPELSIETDKQDAITLRIKPQECYAAYGSQRFASRFITSQRVESFDLSPSQRKLLKLIPIDGLSLPEHLQPRILTAVAALAKVTRVHSSDSDLAAVAQVVEADAEPWVLLEPFEAGLSVALVVEPIRETETYFEPGGGGVTVFVNKDGQTLQTTRDYAIENAALNRLVDNCARLGVQPTQSAPMLLPDPIDCLELLEELHAIGTRCKWPKGKPIEVIASATGQSLNVRIKSAEEWLQASGELRVKENEVISLVQLLDLFSKNPGSRFVEIQSGQFLALSQTFRRQLADLATLMNRSGRDGVRLHPLATPALDGILSDANVEADQAFAEQRARIAQAEWFEPELPSTLTAELRPYQTEGYAWMARLAEWGAGACLADDMGLGKTVQALALLLNRAPVGPALVVAPTSVVANWVAEARRFAPTLNVRTYIGTVTSRTELLESAGPFDLFITTYGLLPNDIERLANQRWHTVVLDEAQAIKNSATKRARAARRLTADFRLITTGTPIQNNLLDLHSLFGFLNPGLLGSTRQFTERFNGVMDGSDREGGMRLRRLIAPFVLRRMKHQVLEELPERTEITLSVKLGDEEAALYEAIRERAVRDLEKAQDESIEAGEGVKRVQILAHLTRLRLACCHPQLALDSARFDLQAPKESAKLDVFSETLTELIENKHKVLVFSQFVKLLRLAEQRLKDIGVSYQYLDGSTPAKTRQERINAFQSGEGDAFLISLRAGGTGLNLTAADFVIHLDPWWNPAVEDQASDRAHRIGQTRPVTIYRLVTEGTIEEQIVDLHRQKRDLANRLLEDTDSTARLSADELLNLLRNPIVHESL